MTDAYAVADGETLTPTSYAQGPWGPGTVNGQVVGALLARGLEQVLAAPGFRAMRLTVDLTRMLRLEPCRVTAQVDRAGGRLRAGSARLHQGDAVVASARGLFAVESAEPPGRTFSSSWPMPPVPTDWGGDHPTASVRGFGAGPADASGDQTAVWAGPGPKQVWVREPRVLVEGEELTPFLRAALAGDVASPMTNWGSEGLAFINADYTVALARLPVGPDVGLVSVARQSADGISTAYAAMVDRDGPVGGVLATAIANPAFVGIA